MKILKTIVNEQHRPIGFEVEGQAWEFGGIGNIKVTTQIAMENMHQQRFKNSQIEMKDGKIIEQGGFKLRTLPMLMATDGGFVEIDNSIKLVNRIIVDGKLAGFDVIIGGIPKRLTSESIISNAGWFNPDNFIVRYSDKVRYIAGKAGMSIEKLPEISLTSAPVSNKKNKVRTATQGKGREYTVQNISPYDMINLTKILKEVGGKFIYLPGVNYKRISEGNVALDKSFVKTGVEVSYPEIDYSEKTVNVSIPFKQIGKLIVDVDGVDKTYYPFAYKKKTVFEAGKLNSPHLGIAVKASEVEKIQSQFGASLSLSVITDPMTNMYVKAFLNERNTDDIALLSLNTENLSAMSIENAKKYRLSEKEIKELYRRLIHKKVCISYIRGVMKDAESTAKEITGREPKPLYGPYKSLSEHEINCLVNAGIDVFTGAFVKEAEKTTDSTTAKKKDLDTPSKVNIAVEYGISGYKSLPSYSVIKSGKMKAETYGPEIAQIEAIRQKLNEYNSSEKVYQAAKAIYDRLDSEKSELIEKIWLNNMACLTLGGMKGFAVNNPSKWSPTKSLMNGIAYGYSGEEAEGLTLNLSGLTIAQSVTK